MSEISRNLLSYKAVFPRWLMALLIGGSLVGGIVPLPIYPSSIGIMMEPLMMEPPSKAMAPKPAPQVGSTNSSGRAPASAEPTPPQEEAIELGAVRGNSDLAQKVVAFGINFCIAAATLSALILLVSVPIFLFSSDQKRVIRAGGLVKTTLGFFIGSATAIIATISFSNIL
jgi:hypothetical protein